MKRNFNKIAKLKEQNWWLDLVTDVLLFAKILLFMPHHKNIKTTNQLKNYL